MVRSPSRSYQLLNKIMVLSSGSQHREVELGQDYSTGVSIMLLVVASYQCVVDATLK